MPPPLFVTFAFGDVGPWRIDTINTLSGDSLPAAGRVRVIEGAGLSGPPDADWILRGITSNQRYTTRPELDVLAGRQQGLARPQARCAALIPIRKTEAWWALAQDERRAIFEDQSHHIGIGLDYLPAIARRLHHSRELGEAFDFITWFEFAPEHSGDFDELLRRLRGTREWDYVDREVDIRLNRDDPPA